MLPVCVLASILEQKPNDLDQNLNCIKCHMELKWLYPPQTRRLIPVLCTDQVRTTAGLNVNCLPLHKSIDDSHLPTITKPNIRPTVFALEQS